MLTIDLKVLIPLVLFAIFLSPSEDGDLLVLRLCEYPLLSICRRHLETVQVLFYNSSKV